MKNKIMKELLTMDRNAARALHEALHVDFCGQYSAYKINGKFTINQILKTAASDGYNPNNASIIVIMTGIKYRDSDFYTVRIEDAGKIDNDFKFYSTHGTKLHELWRKGDFNDYRKEEQIKTFIICQKESDLAHMSAHNPDYTQRFKLGKVQKYRTSAGDNYNEYIGEIELTRTDDNGSRCTLGGWRNKYYFSYNRPERRFTDVSEVIDKSGYIINEKRENLKRRAEALRKERAKDAYKATDNSKKLADLKKALFDKKAYFAKALSEATTAAEVSAITDKLWKYNGLQGLFKDFESIQEHDSKKEFSSVEKFQKYCDDLESSLAAL